MTDASISARLLSQSYRWRLLIVLLIASSLSFADRSVFSVTAQTIKQALHFSDTQLGLLQGIGFAVVYAVGAVPIARFAEHHSRVRIISIAVAAWSLMTAFSGMPVNFIQMLLCRAGVGVGEAGGSAPATSLISDHFPRERRSAANSIILCGSPVGSLIGGLVGGWVAQNHGWRAAFFVLAAPGLIVALLVLLTLREPPRGLADGAPPTTVPPPSLWTVFKFMAAKPTFILVWIGGSSAAIGMSSVSQFMVPFLARSYHLSVLTTSQYYSWISFIGLSAGLLIGGFTADRLGVKDGRWRVWGSAIGVFCAAPLYFGAFSQTHLWGTVTFLILGGFSLFLYYAPTVAVVQNMATPRMRASAAALFGLVFSTAGPGMGPTLMGLFSDFFARRMFHLGDFAALCPGGIAHKGAPADVAHACLAAASGGLREAFLTVLTVAFLTAGVFFLLASLTLRKDVYRPETDELSLEPAPAL